MLQAVPQLAHLVGQPHAPHPLHGLERAWPQTNCSVDLMIELVSALGHDPVWMMSFTLAQDFEGDHFTFFKTPANDLKALYGLSLLELAMWDDLETHVLEQVQRGRVVLLEADSYFLPDTRGISYREHHGKTTVGIFAIDTQQQVLHYFHNEARAELRGEDYDGVLQRLPTQANLLMPYTEFIKLAAPAVTNQMELALTQLRREWTDRPTENPLRQWAHARLSHDLAELVARGQAYFHAYAFNTVRQFGANFGLLGPLLQRFDHPSMHNAAVAADALADEAKVLQFKFARAMARGRADGLLAGVSAMADTYDRMMDNIGSGLGHL